MNYNLEHDYWSCESLYQITERMSGYGTLPQT